MEYLTISVVGEKNAAILSKLTDYIAKNDCNIVTSRITQLGIELGVLMLISGNWSGIAKLEAGIPNLENDFGAHTLVKRTKMQNFDSDLLPYSVHVTALDQSGVVAEITHFFVSQEILVSDLQLNTYKSSHTGTQMLSLVMGINVPADISISDLRENFLLLCDSLNLDGVLEPEKH